MGRGVRSEGRGVGGWEDGWKAEVGTDSVGEGGGRIEGMR